MASGSCSLPELPWGRRREGLCKRYEVCFHERGSEECGRIRYHRKYLPQGVGLGAVLVDDGVPLDYPCLHDIFPISALDGGHVLFLLYEIIARRKPSDKFLEYAQMVGMFLPFGLLIWANFNDVLKFLF